MWEECYATCNRKKFDLCASSSYGECPHLLALTFPESSDSSDTSRHEPNNASSLKRHEELPKMKARQPNPYTHRQKYIYIYTLHTNIDFKKKINQMNIKKTAPAEKSLGSKRSRVVGWMVPSLTAWNTRRLPKATGADEHCEQFASSFHRWKPHKYTYIRDRGSIHKHFKPRKYWKTISSTVSNRCMGAIRFA